MEKIAIIGTVGVPGKYGGFETLAHQLVNQLSAQFKMWVYCSKKAYPKNERKKHMKGARLVYLPFDANGMQSIIYDVISMIHAVFVADTLVILGVSGGMFVPVVRIFTNKKIIVNIDGLEWRRAKWSKFAKWFLHLSEMIAVKWSHADITDNEMIKRYTAIQYKTVSHLIEYGADHVLNKKDSTYGAYKLVKGRYAFKVARIEPENNCHVVLKAFENTTYPLVFVGNWDNSEYGQALKAKYKDVRHIFIVDPIYDQDQLDLFRSNCSIYIHGHSAGGTNPSLVEAMNLQLPIVAFDVSYNRATTEDKALFFKNDTDLCELVNKATSEELLEVGAEMRVIACRRYTWSVIAQKYAQLIYAVQTQKEKVSVIPKLRRLSQQDLLEGQLGHMATDINYFEERY